MVGPVIGVRAAGRIRCQWRTAITADGRPVIGVRAAGRIRCQWRTAITADRRPVIGVRTAAATPGAASSARRAAEVAQACQGLAEQLVLSPRTVVNPSRWPPVRQRHEL